MKQVFQLLPVHHDIKKLQGTMNELADSGYEYLDCVRRTQGQQYIIMSKLVPDEEIQTKLIDPEEFKTQDDFDQIRISHQAEGEEAEVQAKTRGYSIKNKPRLAEAQAHNPT